MDSTLLQLWMRLIKVSFNLASNRSSSQVLKIILQIESETESQYFWWKPAGSPSRPRALKAFIEQSALCICKEDGKQSSPNWSSAETQGDGLTLGNAIKVELGLV
ncbi:hypothetical protein Scep_012353 [Stephania cephalantha]|uniref:Uncharacterized protein n=1 Tax=Stephania cephalantha TaxID=152367 RepID=A0AAP0JGY5_9MAGN